MKIVSTEIDEDSVELTCADNALLDAAEKLVIVRLPIQGPLKRPVLWHQLMILREAERLIGEEARRIHDELEKPLS